MSKTSKTPRYRLSGTNDGASVHLTLSGFADNSPIDAVAIAKMLEQLPPAHLQAFRQIEYQSHKTEHWFTSIGWIKKRGGMYEMKKRKITLYPTTSEKLLSHTLFHEIGHAVFFHHLPSKIRKEWVTQVYRRKRGRFVSLYAKRNAGEDFAESYAFYALEPEVLQEIPAKYRFFQEKVFGEGGEKAISRKEGLNRFDFMA